MRGPQNFSNTLVRYRLPVQYMRESCLIRYQSLVHDHIMVPLRIPIRLESCPRPLEGTTSDYLVRKFHLLLVLLLIHSAHDLTHGCVLGSWYFITLTELMVARRNGGNRNI